VAAPSDVHGGSYLGRLGQYAFILPIIAVLPFVAFLMATRWSSGSSDNSDDSNDDDNAGDMMVDDEVQGEAVAMDLEEGEFPFMNFMMDSDDDEGGEGEDDGLEMGMEEAVQQEVVAMDLEGVLAGDCPSPAPPMRDDPPPAPAAADASAVAAAPSAPAPPKPKPRTKSMAHEDILAKRIVYIHVNAEDGGPQCGLLRLSAIIQDSGFNTLGEFDKFVRPPDGAVWEVQASTESHGYKPTDDFIVNAQPIVEVWHLFVEEVERHLDGGSNIGMLMAWAGKGGCCSKLINITEVQHKEKLCLPRWTEYFCDPAQVIQHYNSCQLNDSKRGQKPQGYGLEVVYSVAFGKELDGGRNSLTDARAQASIVAAKLVAFIDKTKSVQRMADFWCSKKRRATEAIAAPTRSVATTSHSIAHEAIEARRVVYIHVDVEDGGPQCGLLQLSAVIQDCDFNTIGQFDEFVRPPEGAVWNEQGCAESHGYKPTDDFIVNAKPITDVWPLFVEEVERHLDEGSKVGMLMAWAGKGSDCSCPSRRTRLCRTTSKRCEESIRSTGLWQIGLSV
jgi:hypothetical protein